jgi:hypothetical protein
MATWRDTTFAACHPQGAMKAASMVRVVAVVLMLQCACFIGHASIGAATPLGGETERSSRARFAGTWGVGTGYLGKRGGFAVGVAADHVPPGKNHIGVGGFGLATVQVAPRIQAFGRVTITQAVDASTTKCTPQICGTAVGVTLGAHLVHVKIPERDFDGDIDDAPRVLGAGMGLAVRRVELDGTPGYYIGLELSVLVGGAMTTSQR